jgi:hypothetical protein
MYQRFDSLVRVFQVSFVSNVYYGYNRLGNRVFSGFWLWFSFENYAVCTWCKMGRDTNLSIIHIIRDWPDTPPPFVSHLSLLGIHVLEVERECRVDTLEIGELDVSTRHVHPRPLFRTGDEGSVSGSVGEIAHRCVLFPQIWSDSSIQRDCMPHTVVWHRLSWWRHMSNNVQRCCSGHDIVRTHTSSLCGQSTQRGKNNSPCSVCCVSRSIWCRYETVVVGHVVYLAGQADYAECLTTEVWWCKRTKMNTKLCGKHEVVQNFFERN